MKSAVLAVTCDPGGADVVIPVVKELDVRGISAAVAAAGRSPAAWRREGIEPDAENERWLEGELGEAEADEILDRFDPRILVAATSINAAFERSIIRAARRRSLPVVVVMDSHHELIRETPPGERGDYTLAISERMRRNLVDADYAPDRVIVAGQLAYEEVGSKRPSLESRREELKRKWSPDGRLLILIVSDNLTQAFGHDGAKNRFGYDEIICRRDIVSVLGRMSARHGTFRTIVKLHPKEHWPEADDPCMVSHPGLDIAVLQQADTAELIIASDLVIGGATIAMVWATLLERPTISYQPGCREPGLLHTVEDGVTPLVTDAGALQEVMENMLFRDDLRDHWLDKARRWHPLAGGRSMAAELICNLLKG